MTTYTQGTGQVASGLQDTSKEDRSPIPSPPQDLGSDVLEGTGDHMGTKFNVKEPGYLSLVEEKH